MRSSSDDPAINDYGDLSTASPSVTGHFIEVPREIATGKDADDGHEVTSADFGYPTPAQGGTPAMPDGPQWVLEHWSNLNNVFQFIRIEDIAYDRKNGKTVYFADTGEPRAKPSATTTRLFRDSTGGGPYMNGRLYKLRLNSRNPLGTATLSILPGANFDDLGYQNANSPHQPDNVETDAERGLLPGRSRLAQRPAVASRARPTRGSGGTTSKTHALTVVAEVDQSMSPITNKGAWESSGIVDASSVFGRGAFLVDVQAHGWDMDAGAGNDPPAVPKRERGQLLAASTRPANAHSATIRARRPRSRPSPFSERRDRRAVQFVKPWPRSSTTRSKPAGKPPSSVPGATPTTSSRTQTRRRRLTAEDLENLAEAAWWTGRLDEAIALRERAYAASVAAGEPRRAAMIAAVARHGLRPARVPLRVERLARPRRAPARRRARGRRARAPRARPRDQPARSRRARTVRRRGLPPRARAGERASATAASRRRPSSSRVRSASGRGT